MRTGTPRHSRPDIQARRREWFDSQLDLDPERLIFIDETGANTKMARLRGWRESDIVVMDTLSSHKVAGVRQLIESVSATLLYLPPYSPDFNPIEMAFSKLKAALRKAAARTRTDLWDAIVLAIETFSPTECENDFAAAGYDRE